MFCLTESKVNLFKEKLKSGEINPEKLVNMTSEERRAFFAGFLGEQNATQVNALFESKLILKNQQQGIINWAKQVAGMKPKVQRDILARVEKMTEILTPSNQDAFLEDLVAQKIGTSVTMEEAAKISELAKDVADKKVIMESAQRRADFGNPTPQELEYGSARIVFDDYIATLKIEDLNIKEKLLSYFKHPQDVIRDVANTSKAIASSFDNSFILRQGYKVLFRNPKIWKDSFKKSFEIIWNDFKGRSVLDEIRAEILSDPKYELIKRAKVATATIEEAYPTSWPAKIPVLGKFFKASEDAFTGTAYYMRYKTAKWFLDIADKSGVDLTDVNELESIGKLVNSMTARGDTGIGNAKPGIINAVFWSPKKIKGDVDFLLVHAFDKNLSAFARKQAAINLSLYIAGMAAIMATAYTLYPKGVETNPASSDFGQIKVGNRRWDYTGGVRPLAVLAYRIISGEFKSSTTGKTTSLRNPKYGESNSMDVIYNFLENKTSPAASVLVDIMNNRNRTTGRKPTVLNEVARLGSPITISNLFQLGDETAASYILGILSDFLGVSSNIYTNTTPKKTLPK